MCNEDRAADLDHRFLGVFFAVDFFAEEKRKFNRNANVPPRYAVQDEFGAKADEFGAKDRDLNKKTEHVTKQEIMSVGDDVEVTHPSFDGGYSHSSPFGKSPLG